VAAEKLTIQTVDVSHVRAPLPKPAAVSTFQIPAVDTCAITLRTREGVSGVGWCAAFGAEKCRALMAMVRDLFGVLVGKDAGDTEGNWAAMRQAASFVGRDGISAMAIGALDTALWDIKAKAAGAPLWKLLGGERTEIPAYASEGLWINAEIGELREEAASFIERGHAGMKLRVGKPDLREDIARAAAVREVIGPEIALMVDANQGWTVERAKEACRALREFGPEWVEEPVDHEDVRGCAEVAADTDIPVCQGETSWNERGMRHLLVVGAADVLMADLQRCSGVTGWLRVAGAAREHGVPITPHLFHETSAHLMSATPHAVWCEHMPWWEPILSEPMAFKDGHLILTDKPGIGVEWDEVACRRYAPAPGGD
jgi:L-alanine-DL-glutamate epimerase-like enolase superfamily enzyme